MITLDPETLARAHRQFRQAERMANIGSWRLTLADNRLEWSDQVYAIHGLPVGESPPLDGALGFYPPTARLIIQSALARTIETGQPFDVESDFTTASGIKRRVRAMGELETHNGVAVAVIGVFQDITTRHELEQALRRLATTDELTGLSNRTAFNAAIDERIVQARSTGDRLALLLIDLDGFKAINDELGHRSGDALLVDVAERLRRPYLADCFAARLGGDEFVIIVSEPEECERLESIIARLLVDLRIRVDTLLASATIGAAWLDTTVASPADLVHNADSALYSAKRTRRGTARIFGLGRTIVAAPDCPPTVLSMVA